MAMTILENTPVLRHQPLARTERSAPAGWRSTLPVLTAPGVTLRDLCTSDAPALLRLLTSHEVARFISPPPMDVDGFERFIAWAHQERTAGRYVCFAVVADGVDGAAGVFQVRQLDPQFGVAEWGFALGRPFWGTGVFTAAAHLTIDFAFEQIGVHRLEARAAVANGRGNGALAKLGAVREGTLRRSFVRDGRQLDQALWSIVREDWWRAKAVWGSVIH
jgi:ribosomal-protein-alanine N-acetyltransferase